MSPAIFIERRTIISASSSGALSASARAAERA
jgi:hypothetical protein